MRNTKEEKAQPKDEKEHSTTKCIREFMEEHTKNNFKAVFCVGVTPDDKSYSTSAGKEHTENEMIGAVALAHTNFMMDMIMNSKMKELIEKLRPIIEEKMAKGMTIN